MKVLKVKLFMDDGNEFEYTPKTPVGMTINEMTTKLVNLESWLVANGPDGSTSLINARHIKWITVKEVERETNPAEQTLSFMRKLIF